MIKMKSHHPLLVDNEARTEFETNEQHARELELAGLALRVESAQPEAEQPASIEAEAAPSEINIEQPEAEPAVAVAPAKIKKAK